MARADKPVFLVDLSTADPDRSLLDRGGSLPGHARLGYFSVTFLTFTCQRRVESMHEHPHAGDAAPEHEPQ